MVTVAGQFKVALEKRYTDTPLKKKNNKKKNKNFRQPVRTSDGRRWRWCTAEAVGRCTYRLFLRFFFPRPRFPLFFCLPFARLPSSAELSVTRPPDDTRVVFTQSLRKKKKTRKKSSQKTRTKRRLYNYIIIVVIIISVLIF